MSSSKLETMQFQARRMLQRVVPWFNQKGASSNRNYKGTRGRIGVVGGARDYAGAPYFASISAMKLGVDLAYVICSRDAGQVIKTYSPDLIVTPLLDCPDEAEFDIEIECLLKRIHALVVGPGLGREKSIKDRAEKIIKKAVASQMPLILDADSLSIVNEQPAIIQSYSRVLLTPNRIELQRLLDSMFAPKSYDLKSMQTEEIQKLVKDCSKHLGVTILAKGMVDIVCDETMVSPMLTNEASGSDRRCGGQGDITCGLAAAFIHWIEQAKKYEGTEIENSFAWAGYLAVTTTRRANELSYKELGNGSLTTNMIDKIPAALDSLLKHHESTSISGIIEYAGLLSKDEIDRYARQMIMAEFGPSRQVALKNSSALIIGAGGLGCPAAVYLGAGGLGTLGLVDHDRVESSNLHRQVLHNMNRVGMLKTESIKQAVLDINPNVKIKTHSVKLDRYNAVDLVENYDVIIDCTDNLLTRYMISDACVIAKKPLVSGAALKTDGQLTVYNYDKSTPCFRCLFPEPPPPNAIGSCSDNGVLGVIPGIVGTNQALEAIKIITGMKPAYAGKMLLFDGQLGIYRQVTLGKRKPGCESCGPDSKLDRHLIDYDVFCGKTCKTEASTNILSSEERITVQEYKAIMTSMTPHVLVDVRPIEQSNVSRFKHAIQLPVMMMLKEPESTLQRIQQGLSSRNARIIYVICRKGIASQKGTKIIKDYFKDVMPDIVVKDIIGGMTEWAREIDPEGFSCV